MEDNRITVYKNMYTIEARKRYLDYLKTKNKRIIAAWLPRHKGVKDNELDDEMAKTGTLETATRGLKVPYNNLKEEYKNEAWRNTQEQHRKQEEWKGKKYFDTFWKKERRKEALV